MSKFQFRPIDSMRAVDSTEIKLKSLHSTQLERSSGRRVGQKRPRNCSTRSTRSTRCIPLISPYLQFLISKIMECGRTVRPVHNVAITILDHTAFPRCVPPPQFIREFRTSDWGAVTSTEFVSESVDESSASKWPGWCHCISQ